MARSAKVCMHPVAMRDAAKRYQNVDAAKACGATYTPANLARFVAERIVECADLAGRSSLSILDPAVGDGALVLALLEALEGKTNAALSVCAFDTDSSAMDEAARRIRAACPQARLELTQGSFLDFVQAMAGGGGEPSLPARNEAMAFDLIIANPPYVRTQIMGSRQARRLAAIFGLAGRVDLYQAFLLGVAQALAPDGAAGIIAPNRFMTTGGGGALRAALRRRFSLRHIWDLGDSKLFKAAVLPSVIVARGTACTSDGSPRFSSIYEVKDRAGAPAADPLAALDCKGVVEIADGRRFRVRHGALGASGADTEVWRLASRPDDEWLATADRRAWKRFGDIGKIRVGVKTCADGVFIRHDWDAAFGADKPELLRTLITHREAGRFRAASPREPRAILYPHEVAQGQRRAVRLEDFPKSRAYLETHRARLEGRAYVIEAGRRWYELWVPQNPEAWASPKLVFRDISERPTFWIDMGGAVVNGDCYWLAASREDETDLLWLAAAVANSTFAEKFYDYRFNNRLYAGRRRFITQYVQQFPLPDPSLPLTRDIIARAKAICEANHSPETQSMEEEADRLVWRAFGLERGPESAALTHAAV